MPLIAVLTVCSIVLPTEWMARKLFGRTKTNMLDCLVVNDPSTGVRGIPNCVCWQKVYEESKPTEYKLNSRGDRAGTELLPKQAGTFRIVMVGSSVAEGMRVAREQSLAALLPRALAAETGRSVELYNEGMMYGTPRRVDLQFARALEAQPDMILWPLTPWDIANASVADAPWAKAPIGILEADPNSKGIWPLFIHTLDRSRTVIMLRHELYKSQTSYVHSYLMQQEGGQFMRSVPSAATQLQLRQVERYVADVARKAEAAHVPLVVTLVPHGAQATMISMGKWPAGFDPYLLGREVRAIVERHGGTYVDILGAFRQVAEPQRLFLAVDGHPTSQGHRVLTGMLAKALASEMPELNAESFSGKGIN